MLIIVLLLNKGVDISSVVKNWLEILLFIESLLFCSVLFFICSGGYFLFLRYLILVFVLSKVLIRLLIGCFFMWGLLVSVMFMLDVVSVVYNGCIVVLVLFKNSFRCLVWLNVLFRFWIVYFVLYLFNL